MSWLGFCFSNGIGDATDDIYVPLEFFVEMKSNSLGLTAEESKRSMVRPRVVTNSPSGSPELGLELGDLRGARTAK
jgi:hypothetical protein